MRRRTEKENSMKNTASANTEKGRQGNITIKLFAWLLCAVIAATTLAACKKQPDGSNTDSQSESASRTETPSESQSDTAQPTENNTFKLSSEVTVLRSDTNKSEDIMTALTLVHTVLSDINGEKIEADNDWYRGELVRHKYEILIGDTNRPESIAALDELTYYDYKYEVVSPECVVICGGSDSATLSAAMKFLSDCYGYIPGGSKGEKRELDVGKSYTYRHDYGLEKLKICGIDASEYTIVYAKSTYAKKAAASLEKEIEKQSGVKLKISEFSEFKGGHAIYIGCDASGNHLRNVNYGSYTYILKHIPGDNSSVVIDTYSNYESTVRAFAKTFLASIPKKGTYDLKISDTEYVGANCSELMNGLMFVSETTENIADGVTYSKRVYRDEKGKPVIAYVVRADLKKVDIINATPGLGDTIGGVRSTTLKAMKDATAAGYEVYAGVNADFFRISSDYSPQGLCIRNGKLLSGPNDAQWFGIMKDGTPVIGSTSDYNGNDGKYKNGLAEAVGGRKIIVKNGYIYDIDGTNDFGTIRHPRTAVGIDSDGNVILMVVDGRQPSLSNGASLGDLAGIMIELGAVDALNLDGGGSSTFVTSSTPGKYVTRNSPSDGSLRNVYNSLIVVKKK